MRSLILGITGCAGSHLADHLLNKGHDVFGTKRATSLIHNIRHNANNITLFDIDLNDKASIISTLKRAKPDQIYFLVSARHVDTIKNLCNSNVEGTLLFFETLTGLPYRPRIVLTSSSAVYGIQKGTGPISENDPLLPSTHYSLSKVLQEEIAKYYCTTHNIDIVIARPFNHPGPREEAGLVCSDFAKQIAAIERCLQKPVIRVGNLESRRDFTDVRDTVRGYALLAEKGRQGETYNICSGRAYSIKTILNRLIAMSSVRITVITDTSKIRSGEITIQEGNNSKISAETDWKPRIPLDRTLKDILTFYRDEKV